MFKRLDNRVVHMLLCTVASYLAFAASNELFPSYIRNELFEYIFSEIVPINGIIFNFAVGITVSYIFYFLVVFLPERRAKEHIRPILSKRVNKINDAVERMINYISSVSCIELQYSNLDKQLLKDALSKVNSQSQHESFVYHVPRKNALGQFVFVDKKVIFDKDCYTLNQKFAHEWSIVRKNRMQLFELYGLLSTDLIEELDSIDNIECDSMFSECTYTFTYSETTIYKLYDFSRKIRLALER